MTDQTPSHLTESEPIRQVIDLSTYEKATKYLDKLTKTLPMVFDLAKAGHSKQAIAKMINISTKKLTCNLNKEVDWEEAYEAGLFARQHEILTAQNYTAFVDRAVSMLKFLGINYLDQKESNHIVKEVSNAPISVILRSDLLPDNKDEEKDISAAE